MEYIKGKFRKSLFQGDNGYLVSLFKITETNPENGEFTNQTVTITGYFHEFNDSDNYLLNGKFVFHQKYGEQFQVDNYERLKPEDKDSIVTFLSSGLFKGIGEKTAKKVVDVLGKDTLNIILENPNDLLLIPTINKRHIDMLHNTLVDYESSYKTILFLTELGFSTKESMLIYNKYRVNTLNKVEDNLYNIFYDFIELSFKKVDLIASSKEYAKDDIRRVEASIIYVITEITNLVGHSYVLQNEIFNNIIKVLRVSIEEELFVNAINNLITDLKIVKEDEKYYLIDMYESEDGIVNRVKYLLNQKEETVKKLDQKISDLELINNITYNDEQLDAIKKSITKHFLIITGGPGTGKTTIVKSIVELYKETYKLSSDKLLQEMVLLAPTGRASKRLSESTLFPACTIHRFLKWNKETNKFAVNEYSKSDAKIVIIDEASMIDVYLFFNLLKGLKTDTKIILVGDYNQLPSVGPGQVLKDLIESGVAPVISLNRLYRQKEGSNIIDLAYKINEGSFTSQDANDGHDLNFIKSSSTDVLDNVKKISEKHKKNSFKDFQILAPMYKTLNGIDNINKLLQNVFNPKTKTKNEILLGDIIYREGDKVLQLSNMPDENVFNGDIGIISSILKKEIIIDFDGNMVRFTPSNYHKFKHGYAISIHKSQGSEFKNVVILVDKSYHKMLYRKLYYTAITRSKKKLYIVGDVEALRMASNNNLSDIRRTELKDKLIMKMNNI